MHSPELDVAAHDPYLSLWRLLLPVQQRPLAIGAPEAALATAVLATAVFEDRIAAV